MSNGAPEVEVAQGGTELPIEVKVARLPGLMHNVALDGGHTVADAFDAAGIEYHDGEIRVNGEPTDDRQELNQGDTVTVLRKITGN